MHVAIKVDLRFICCFFMFLPEQQRSHLLEGASPCRLILAPSVLEIEHGELLPPVYSHVIVVESFVHRSGSGAGPYAVSVLCQDSVSLAAEAEADGNGLSFRGMNSETGVSL